VKSPYRLFDSGVRVRSSLFRKVPLHWFVFVYNISGHAVGAIFKGELFKEEDATDRLFRNLVTNCLVTQRNIPDKR
jgi:hypothetical protein